MFDLHYEITLQDYVDSDMSWFARPWFRFIMLQALPAFLIIGSCISLIFFEQLFNDIPHQDQVSFRFMLAGYGIIGIIFPIYMSSPILRRLRKRRRMLEIAESPIRVGARVTTITAEQLSIAQGSSILLQVPWQRIARMRETDSLLIFDFKWSSKYTFIPKRAFESSQDLENFRQALDSWL